MVICNTRRLKTVAKAGILAMTLACPAGPLLEAAGGKTRLEELPAEPFLPPGPQEVATILTTAETNGWVGQHRAVTERAVACYEAGYLDSGYAWHGLGRWMQFLALSQQDAMRDWGQLLRTAKLDHGRVRSKSYRLTSNQSLATLLPKELRVGIPSDSRLLRVFFDSMSGMDCPMEVLNILRALFEADPLAFHEYFNLAMAVAVVYDVPPPADWPHSQVRESLLPGKQQDPLVVFRRLVELDRSGRSLKPLSQLPTGELKYVVDVSATDEELRWAQVNIQCKPGELQKLYSMVKYRMDRIQVFRPMWLDERYRLEDILAKGGICVDQAYFACQVGKAHGVPTILFKGAALDMRHAWLGYLGAKDKWVLDAGRTSRIASSSIAYATDPQVWAMISEQNLVYLERRHQMQARTGVARVHADFARTYLIQGKTEKAETAMRKALELDPINPASWDFLLMVLQKRKASPEQVEQVMRDSVKAMEKLPDLESRYSTTLCTHLRTQGKQVEADKEQVRLAEKYRKRREDLSAVQTSQILFSAIQEQPVESQMPLYRQLMEKQAKGGGVVFLDVLVAPYVAKLMAAGRKVEAREALQLARRVLKVEKNGMLDLDLGRLEKQLD